MFILKSNLINFTGTPLQYINREKQQSACRSIGDSIKKHIFHKTLTKTPKISSANTPSSSSMSAAKITKTPLVSVSLHAKIINFLNEIF